MATSTLERKAHSRMKSVIEEVFKDEIIVKEQPLTQKEIKEIKQELEMIEKNNPPGNEADIIMSESINSLRDTLKTLGIIKVYKVMLSSRRYDIIFGFVRPKHIGYYGKLKDGEKRIFQKDKITKKSF